MSEAMPHGEPTESQPGNETPSSFEMFANFLRMGLTAFGGPAMIPYVRQMAVVQKRWLDGQSFQEGVALCQTIPGATVMQLAAYIGLKARGVRGAMASYVGFILPAFLLMLVLSFAYARTRELPAVVAVLSGLQAVIVAVAANATLAFGRTSLKKWSSGLVALIAAALFWLRANPALIIFLAASLGVVLNPNQHAVGGPSRSSPVRSTTGPLLLLLAAWVLGFATLSVLRRDLFHLGLLMIKVDLLAFGGGFGSVPLMFHEIVEVRSWMDGPTFLNGIVLGQFTPGPIVITATFVGYLVGGFPGACVATAAVFLPSFLILIGIAPWFDRLRSSPGFAGAIAGILGSFVGLLATVTLRFGLNVPWDPLHALFAAAAFAALSFKVDILWVVLAATASLAFLAAAGI